MKTDLADLSPGRQLANQVSAAPRAVELARRAIELVGDQDPHRAAMLHVLLGELLLDAGHDMGGSSRPSGSPGPDRAGRSTFARARVCVGVPRGSADGRLAACGVTADRRGGAPARPGGRRARGGGPGAHRARRQLGYLGRADEGLRRPAPGAATGRRDRRPLGPGAGLRQSHRRTDDAGPARGVGPARAGRTRGAARVRHRQRRAHGQRDRGAARERRLDRGGRPERGRPAPRHDGLAHMFLMLRADLEVGRGDFDAARTHLDAALATLPEDPARDLRCRLRRRAGPVGAPLDGCQSRRAGRPGSWSGPWRRLSSASGSARRACGPRRIGRLAQARRDTEAVRDWCDQAGE